jgi:threonine-phosphate decarboxylase
MNKKKHININLQLFAETLHSPSLIDMVGPSMMKKVIDFCFIANPYYPGPKLIKKIQRQLPHIVKSYPSSNPKIQQLNLSKVLHVNPEYLVVGNGATELITIIMREMVNKIGIPIPTFSEYTEKLKNNHTAKFYKLPAENNYQLNLGSYAQWIEENSLDSALIINPGNPTGQLISLNEMKTFLRRMAHLEIIIIDESFIDFSGISIPSLLPYVQEFNNLLIVRSMSKHCGMPGLRLGYCCTSNPIFLTKLHELLPVWNINALAEFFLALLEETDKEYHKSRIRVIEDIRQLYLKAIRIEGFKVYPTGSNFILIKSVCGLTSTKLQEILLTSYRLYVRDCTNKQGLDNYHIRVASQGKKKDIKLLKALKEIAKNQQKENNM